MTDWHWIMKLITTLDLEAEQRGDDRASGMLAEIGASVMGAQSDLAAADARREKDRARKRERRLSTDSTESGESTESVEKSGFPPDPLSQKRTTPPLHRAREAGLNVALVDADGVPVAQVDEIDAAVARFALRYPECWPSASAFLCRRPLRTWLGWVKEMVKLIGPGSQYTEADLAATCDDDATLTRPIGSPLGLKSFLLQSREQRVNPPNLERETPRRNGKQPNPGAQQVANILGRSA